MVIEELWNIYIGDVFMSLIISQSITKGHRSIGHTVFINKPHSSVKLDHVTDFQTFTTSELRRQLAVKRNQIHALQR